MTKFNNLITSLVAVVAILGSFSLNANAYGVTTPDYYALTGNIGDSASTSDITATGGVATNIPSRNNIGGVTFDQVTFITDQNGGSFSFTIVDPNSISGVCSPSLGAVNVAYNGIDSSNVDSLSFSVSLDEAVVDQFETVQARAYGSGSLVTLNEVSRSGGRVNYSGFSDEPFNNVAFCGVNLLSTVRTGAADFIAKNFVLTSFALVAFAGLAITFTKTNYSTSAVKR